jgi:hypothetical protein
MTELHKSEVVLLDYMLQPYAIIQVGNNIKIEGRDALSPELFMQLQQIYADNPELNIIPVRLRIIDKESDEVKFNEIINLRLMSGSNTIELRQNLINAKNTQIYSWELNFKKIIPPIVQDTPKIPNHRQLEYERDQG